MSTPGADAIADLIKICSIKDAIYTRSCLGRPWGIKYPRAKKWMFFHLVISGSCYVRVNDKKILLECGDFIILPLGIGHSLSSKSDTITTKLNELPFVEVNRNYRTLSFGGEGEKNKLVCGGLNVDVPKAFERSIMLPDHILINAKGRSESSSVNTLLEIIKKEAKESRDGSYEIISRLAEVVFIKTLRQYFLNTSNEKMKRFYSVENLCIRRVLLLMHKKPEVRWTISKLAENANMSRTSFIMKFKEQMGVSPIEYLTSFRMGIAYKKLLNTEDKITKIALDLGYQCESSFSRAFKKQMNCSPGSLRKEKHSSSV